MKVILASHPRYERHCVRFPRFTFRGKRVVEHGRETRCQPANPNQETPELRPMFHGYETYSCAMASRWIVGVTEKANKGKRKERERESMGSNGSHWMELNWIDASVAITVPSSANSYAGTWLFKYANDPWSLTVLIAHGTRWIDGVAERIDSRSRRSIGRTTIQGHELPLSRWIHRIIFHFSFFFFFNGSRNGWSPLATESISHSFCRSE